MAKRGFVASVVFSLALLYHAWPDFYQRFSSASEAHIRGILDNFFHAENGTRKNAEDEKPNILPLLKDYATEEDLIYFLKTVFELSKYQDEPFAFVDEIINGIRGLRMTGLP